MRAVDTNAVVRLVVRDDPEQVRAAEEFAASGAWISHLVLVETAWVLDAVYERTAEQIATAVEMLLNHKDLTLQDADVVVGALEHFRKRGRSRIGVRARSKVFGLAGRADGFSGAAWPQTQRTITI